METENYTARSQRSLLRQNELQLELAEAEGWVRRHKKKITEDEASKKYILGMLSKPHREERNHAGLNQSLRAVNDSLTDTRDQLAHTEDICARLQAELKSLDLGPEEAKARAKQQGLLFSLIAERLEKDREADKALDELHRILLERAELSDRMAESASAIEFMVSDNGLDTQRFERLLASLPGGLAASSEEWAAWFLGTLPGLQSYIVRDKVLVIGETLVHHGVHHRGDQIQLLEDEARELLREDRPAPTPEAPWRLAAPSIVTLEAYTEAVARGEESGCSIEDVWAHENFQRELERKKHFKPTEGPVFFTSITEAMRG